jgi:oxygen-independent coproporphyrinogen-3 oxidase
MPLVGETERIDGAEIDRITRAVGRVPRVAYEGAHVYPLSAPNFASAPRRARHRIAAGPLKIYVHVPFCRYACTFCFYAKRVNVARAEMERYVAALASEVAWVEPGTPLRQLYVGAAARRRRFRPIFSTRSWDSCSTGCRSKRARR